MDGQEFHLAKNDFDLENIRNRLIKCICELQTRRNEVAALKAELDESNRSKAGFEQDAKNYERELTDLRDQLKIALNALNQKDSIRTGFLENAARQNVQLEALTNDYERLNAKLQSSQLKNNELNREINKLKEQVKVLQTTSNQPQKNMEKIWKAMDTLNSHLQKLEAEHLTLTQTAESSNKIAAEAAAASLCLRRQISSVKEDNISLKKQILDLESKIINLQSSTSKAVGDDESGCISKFEDHLREMKLELEQERETSAKLRNDIAAMLVLQDCLSKQLEDAVKHYECLVKPSDASQVIKDQPKDDEDTDQSSTGNESGVQLPKDDRNMDNQSVSDKPTEEATVLP